MTRLPSTFLPLSITRAFAHKVFERVFPGWAWFEPQFYLAQLNRLNHELGRETKACHSWRPVRQQLHYRLFGWRYGLSPHPLIDPVFYRNQCLRRGWSDPNEPLAHFLRVGLASALAPSPLVDIHWCDRWPSTLSRSGPAPLDHLHPLGRAALLLAGGNSVDAQEHLSRWLEQGFCATDRQAITDRAARFNASEQPVIPQPPGHLQVLGVPLNHWACHAWLQRLPYSLCHSDLLELLTRPAPPGQPIHVLHLPYDDSWWTPAHLSHLQRVDCVLDPSPERVQILKCIGIRAYCIDADAPVNGWLDDIPESSFLSVLGLPSPSQLESSRIIILGSLGPEADGQLTGDYCALPAFKALAEPAIEIGELESSLDQAMILAGWLRACQLAGIQLVRLMPTEIECSGNHYAALGYPIQRDPAWLSCQYFTSPLSEASMLDELKWRSTGFQAPTPIVETPTPSVVCLLEKSSDAPPRASVCISLYNYGNYILAALESVFGQTFPDLELIVVDDASTDSGPAKVQSWLDEYSYRFNRTILLQHRSNGGLASARNTAFEAATSDWCFVLDADNTLEPEALSACMAIASQVPGQVAVIHPLIRDCPHPSGHGLPTLLPSLPWQQQRLSAGNYIDAMALVRRSAWRKVGGYAHIIGGWEDYDFWCSLIGAGFQGLQCPKVLARYNRHQDSMQASTTQPQLRRLSRLLQARHPWLQLPFAAQDV